MDLQRAFLAIILSFLILFGYQYFFVKPVAQPPQASAPTQQDAVQNTATAPAAAVVAAPTVAADPNARDITVETPMYTAVFSEQGGGMKSLVLKNYRTTLDQNSGPMQLVQGKQPADFPVVFSLDNGAGSALPMFKADKTSLTLTQ